MVMRDAKRPPLECCGWTTVGIIKTLYVTTVPVMDGLGRVSSSCKDGEGVSLCIRTCNGGLTGGTTYCGTVQGVYRTRPNDDSMLARAGDGVWEQQQLQQRPSKPLPLPANASDGGWQRQLGRRQLPGPTPLPARAGDGGGVIIIWANALARESG